MSNKEPKASAVPRELRDPLLMQVVGADTAAMGGQTHVQPEEFAVMMAQTQYLLKDDDVTRLMLFNPYLIDLIPAYSHIIATSRLPDQVIKEAKLRLRRALRLQLLVLPPVTNLQSQASFDAMLNFGYSRLEDARNAHRAKVVTERIRTYKIEGAEQKRKLFGLIPY